MKYCPYCGAALAVSAAPFCAECGKALPSAAKPRPSGSRKPGYPLSQKTRPAAKNTAPFFPRPAQKHRGPERTRKPNPRDEGYDGYYDDVKPIDNGHVRERMDSQLVKRIVILAAGAFVLVMFSVILMYLL
jgi:hypothetical protein